ncbi:hypothetical protein FISHEDRAFT_73096, partial [Fistulina hepatica ATCC 64428]
MAGETHYREWHGLIFELGHDVHLFFLPSSTIRIILPIVVHGYTLGYEDLRKLTQHLVGEDIRGYNHVPDPLDAIDRGMVEDEVEDEVEDSFLMDLIDVEYAFTSWADNVWAERK